KIFRIGSNVKESGSPTLIVTPGAPPFPLINNVHEGEKVFPLTLLDAIVTDVEGGENVQPDFVTDKEYVPEFNVSEYAPVESLVVDFEPAVTVAPGVPTLPESK